MKQKFSIKWKVSKQPRKQRKYRYNAPLHLRRKMMSVNLTKELRKKYRKRNFPVHKGDSVRVMKGNFKRKIGKVDIVDIVKYRISIDGVFRSKKDGTKVGVWFSPSNLQIKELNLDDKKRKKALERVCEKSEEKSQVSKTKLGENGSQLALSSTNKLKSKLQNKKNFSQAEDKNHSSLSLSDTNKQNALTKSTSEQRGGVEKASRNKTNKTKFKSLPKEKSEMLENHTKYLNH